MWCYKFGHLLATLTKTNEVLIISEFGLTIETYSILEGLLLSNDGQEDVKYCSSKGPKLKKKSRVNFVQSPLHRQKYN